MALEKYQMRPNTINQLGELSSPYPSGSVFFPDGVLETPSLLYFSSVARVGAGKADVILTVAKVLSAFST